MENMTYRYATHLKIRYKLILSSQNIWIFCVVKVANPPVNQCILVIINDKKKRLRGKCMRFKDVLDRQR